MPGAVEALDRGLARVLGERLLGSTRGHQLGGPMGRRAAEHDEVDQRVAAQPVGAVDRGAAGLTDRHHAGHDRIRAAVARRHDLGQMVGRDAAHVVVAGRHDRDRLLGEVDAGEDLRGLGDPGQALVQQRRLQMLEMQLDVIPVGPQPRPR